MKTLFVLTAFLFLSYLSIGQITYREAVEPKQAITPYDSLEIIPQRSLRSVYGQQVVILGAYSIYPRPDSYVPLERTDLIKKEYTIIKGEKDKKLKNKIWLQLVAETDTIYFELTGSNIERPSFITLGYYEKQKQTHIGKSFKLRLYEDFTELNSGIEKRYTSDDDFICTDVTILEVKQRLVPSFILKNQDGDEIGIPFSNYSNDVHKFVIR